MLIREIIPIHGRTIQVSEITMLVHGFPHERPSPVFFQNPPTKGAESSVQPGTGAGISAAFGKLGATIGSYAFSELKNLGVWARPKRPNGLGNLETKLKMLIYIYIYIQYVNIYMYIPYCARCLGVWVQFSQLGNLLWIHWG